jgi:uncharacterized BrkB/YihY/UPF0761 family membrane protein
VTYAQYRYPTADEIADAIVRKLAVKEQPPPAKTFEQWRQDMNQDLHQWAAKHPTEMMWIGGVGAALLAVITLIVFINAGANYWHDMQQRSERERRLTGLAWVLLIPGVFLGHYLFSFLPRF